MLDKAEEEKIAIEINAQAERLDLDRQNVMSKGRTKDEVEDLGEAIEYHDYLYYLKNDPTISDRAYDLPFDRLGGLEQEFDLVDENSPTQRSAEKRSMAQH